MAGPAGKRPFLRWPAAACLALLLLPGPAPAAGEGKPGGLPVKAAPVRVGSVPVEITAVGSLIANESVVIRPEIAGRVASIHFSEGRTIAAGQRLVTLDPAEYRARLAEHRAEVVLNERRYQRARELVQKNFISQQALDEARENLAQSKARQEQDRVLLGKTEIRAPFGGLLGLRQVSPGAYVQVGQDLVRLEDISALKLDFRIPEVYLAKLRLQQEVSIGVDAFPGRQFAGRVYAFEPALDETTRTILVRAHIANPDGLLRPGMFARISLVLETRNNALLIPEQAIVPRGQESFVFRVADGKAVLAPVKTGQRRPGEVEIVSGLKPGDTVVTEGQIKLQDGAPVTVIGPAPPPTQKP